MKLLALLTILGSIAPLQSRAASPSRPNFVVCIADDVSFDDFGCYGNKSARTPRIEVLAEEMESTPGT